MLEEGVYRNQSELARGEGVSTAAVSIALKALRESEAGVAGADERDGSVDGVHVEDRPTEP
jgi:hypothetical protein